MKANKEATKVISQRGIKQVLKGFQDMTAGPEQAQHPGFQKTSPSSHIRINYSARCFCVCRLNSERVEAACIFHRKLSDVSCGTPAWKWLRWGCLSFALIHTQLIATSADTRMHPARSIRASILARLVIRVVYSADIFIKESRKRRQTVVVWDEDWHPTQIMVHSGWFGFFI